MAALDEKDLKLILGDNYVEKTAAQKLAANKPNAFIAFLKKIFAK